MGMIETRIEGQRMKAVSGSPKNTDEYIAGLPRDVQGILKEIRTTIKKVAPDAEEAIKHELSRYEGAKGSVQFPIDKPMPLTLIERIVKFRVREAQAGSTAKKRNK